MLHHATQLCLALVLVTFLKQDVSILVALRVELLVVSPQFNHVCIQVHGCYLSYITVPYHLVSY